MKRAVVISGGNISDYKYISKQVKNDDFVICADSGVVHCNKMGIEANVIIGDFDSLDYEKCLGTNAAKGAEIVRLIPEKDDTDTEAACTYAANNGFDEILLLGGCGTRADHTISNIMLAEKMLASSVNMIILNEHNRIRLLKNGSLRLYKSRYKYVSLISLNSIAEGVSCCGMKYPLKNETLYRLNSRGISNEIESGFGDITVNNGTLLIIESID